MRFKVCQFYVRDAKRTYNTKKHFTNVMHSTWIYLNTLHDCTFRVSHSCILFKGLLHTYTQPTDKQITNT